MGRRKNTAYKSVRIPVTRGLSLRSRVPGNWHARFCSRGEESDSLVYCNPHRRPVAVLPGAEAYGWAATGDRRASPAHRAGSADGSPHFIRA